MDENNFPADYRDTLLYRSCKSDSEYREVLKGIAERKEAARRFKLPASVYDSRYYPDGTPISSEITLQVRQVDHTTKARQSQPNPSDLERLKQLVRDHPDAVRSILAPVILDIVEEYLKGDDVELETEGQGTQG